MKYEIKPAYGDIETIKKLFREYTASLGIDLSFQNYEEELKSLPGKYCLPKGRLYALYENGKVAGCGALRPINDKDCEMKRLYIKPEFRGKGFGKILSEKIIEEAKSMGYENMYLDTLLSLERAVKMYKNMGFKEIPPYYFNPYPDVAYFRLELQGCKDGQNK